jgi:hypothetical protein
MSSLPRPDDQVDLDFKARTLSRVSLARLPRRDFCYPAEEPDGNSEAHRAVMMRAKGPTGTAYRLALNELEQELAASYQLYMGKSVRAVSIVKSAVPRMKIEEMMAVETVYGGHLPLLIINRLREGGFKAYVVKQDAAGMVCWFALGRGETAAVVELCRPHK